MQVVRPKSLVTRLSLWALLLFAISIPVFWGLFSRAVDEVSRDVVDTRILEFADQVRGFWASSQVDGTGNIATRAGLGGPDVGWVWQISIEGQQPVRSELLRLMGSTLPLNQEKESEQFILKYADTPLGSMRLAERVIQEIPPFSPEEGGNKTIRVRYVVGIDMERYGGYVEEHASRLRNLALLAVVPVSLALLGMLGIIILIIRRDFQHVGDAMHAYEGGEADDIKGHFPKELQGLVDHMNRLLSQNMKLVERTRKYVSKIAHDINHPLAVMKNGLKAEETDRKLLNRQIERMAGLVDRYSSLARAIGPEGLSGRQTAVAVLLEDVAEGFSILYRRTPLIIECVCDKGLTFPIPQHDLEAMVSNLLSNAHKFADSQVRLSAMISESNLVVSVEDDGPGIAQEEREGALNWGKRLDEAAPGTGFGLSIVKDIADLYEGYLQLETSGLGGLKVDVVIPGGSKVF